MTRTCYIIMVAVQHFKPLQVPCSTHCLMGCQSITELHPAFILLVLIYTWVEKGTLRVKCLAQEHNTMSSVRARTQTAQSGVKCFKHEATVPHT